jgi:hypothetical protein
LTERGTRSMEEVRLTPTHSPVLFGLSCQPVGWRCAPAGPCCGAAISGTRTRRPRLSSKFRCGHQTQPAQSGFLQPAHG